MEHDVKRKKNSNSRIFNFDIFPPKTSKNRLTININGLYIQLHMYSSFLSSYFWAKQSSKQDCTRKKAKNIKKTEKRKRYKDTLKISNATNNIWTHIKFPYFMFSFFFFASFFLFFFVFKMKIKTKQKSK